MSPILFAQDPVDLSDLLATMRRSDPASLERILIFGAIGLVTLVLVLWAVFIRKRRRRRRAHHLAPERLAQPIETPVVANDQDTISSHKGRRHRRRSGHRHRRRNPTLAETGGLPPIRPEEPAEPQP